LVINGGSHTKRGLQSAWNVCYSVYNKITIFRGINSAGKSYHTINKSLRPLILADSKDFNIHQTIKNTDNFTIIAVSLPFVP
jgi:hypothetical protein